MLDRIDDVLKKFGDRCDYLEARIEVKESTNITLRGREVDALQQGVSMGGCVRAYVKGGVGFASFNNLDRLESFAEKAVAQARLVGRDRTRLAEAPPVQDEIPAAVVNDPRSVSLEEKLRILGGYNDLILSMDKRIPSSSIRYGDAFRRIWFGNSEGTRLAYEKLDIGCNLSAVAMGGGQTQIGGVGCGSSDDFHCILGHEETLHKECKAAVGMLKAAPIKGGSYTVILDPHLAGVFVHEAFGHMSEGEKVAENSQMAEVMKMGKAFGAPILNIYDSGLDRGTRGAIACDEEGVASRRTDLIREGRLVGRLHTRETAGKMGEAVTGSARALDHSFPPVPRMRNTCIAQGTASFEEMIADVKLGVYAIRAVGGQAGEMFTFTPGRCFMIRNGKVEEMARNAILSGNLFTTMKNIDLIGDDFRQHNSAGGCGKGTAEGFQFPLPVSDGAPHIRIRDVVIGGA